jgi:hypothetical protein
VWLDDPGTEQNIKLKKCSNSLKTSEAIVEGYSSVAFWKAYFRVINLIQ